MVWEDIFFIETMIARKLNTNIRYTGSPSQGMTHKFPDRGDGSNVFYVKKNTKKQKNNNKQNNNSTE